MDPGHHSTASKTPTSATGSLKLLSGADLSKALLGINDLPAGYSQNPPTKSSSTATLRHYKPLFIAKECGLAEGPASHNSQCRTSF